MSTIQYTVLLSHHVCGSYIVPTLYTVRRCFAVDKPAKEYRDITRSSTSRLQIHSPSAGYADPLNAKMSYQTDEESRHSWAINERCLPLISRGVESHLVQFKKKKMTSQKGKLRKDEKTSNIVPIRNKGVMFTDARVPSQLFALKGADLLLDQEDYEIRAEERRMRQKPVTKSNNILADEITSIFCRDRFQKLSRETAFLTGVDVVRQQETEKGFMESEEFTGCVPLSEDEIQDTVNKRTILVAKKNRSVLSSVHRRRHTSSTSSSLSIAKFGVEQSVLQQAIKSLTPSFNQNRNDIWSKRMNTLRVFILTVTRWIIRRRADIRLIMIKKNLRLAIGEIENISNSSSNTSCHGNMNIFASRVFISTSSIEEEPSTIASLLVTRKDLVRKWVEFDHSCNLTKGHHTSKATVQIKHSWTDMLDSHTDHYSSVSKSVLTLDNEPAAARNIFPMTPGQWNTFQGDILKRIFFPNYNIEDCDTLQYLEVSNITAAAEFDDRTLLQLKIRSENIGTPYAPHKIPNLPLNFANHGNKTILTGAVEEHILQYSAAELTLPRPIHSNATPNVSGLKAPT